MSKRKNSTTSKKASSSRRAPRALVVTVLDSHRSKLAQVAEELRSLGLTVESILESTGLIMGESATPASKLAKVPGVQSVEEQPVFQLPPPDSDLQ